MPNTYTFNDDLSCTVLSPDGLKQINLPNYNPSTQKVWSSEYQVKQWVESNNNLTWIVTSELSTQAEQDGRTAISKRDTRNQLLSDSDWTQMPDSPLADEAKALWVTYRTSLRNLPDHADWPNLADADWPTKP